MTRPGRRARDVESFPLPLMIGFVVASLGLVGGGLALWWPQRGKQSTANSDLGLALMGGGLAITAGFVVAVVVFLAERRFDARLRADQDARERQALKQSLSMAPLLSGADLHGADLSGAFLAGEGHGRGKSERRKPNQS